MRTTVLAGLAAALVAGGALAPAPAHAAKPEIYTGLFGNAAVGGYDAVAYFTQRRPVQGDARFKTTWKGAEWRFASAENLAKFKANPAAYAPQYGGYCAWAIAAKDQLVKGDPRYWRIVNGKLYLNFDAKVQRDWEKDIPGFIRKADSRWPAILG
jgi:YHS domain-containing protein